MGARVRFTAGTSGNLFAGTSTSAGTPTSLAGGNVAVTGNYIVVGYLTQNDNRNASSVADAAGTSYTAIGSTLHGAAGSVHLFRGVVAANNAGQTVVVTLDGNNTDKSQVLVWEVSGLNASQVGITTDADATENVTSHGSGPITPADAVGFIIAISDRTNGDYTEDTNFTEETTGDDNFYAGYIASPPAAARSLAYTSVDNEFAVTKIVAFVGAASSTGTALPGVGSLIMQGLTPSANTFAAVAIKEVFINEAGSPVTNRTGIHLMVWYAGSPAGAPDVSYSNLTTDAAGTASWSLPPGGLTYNQNVFYLATDGGASLSQYTCGRLIPTYT